MKSVHCGQRLNYRTATRSRGARTMATQTFGQATPSPLDAHASPAATGKASGRATASFVLGIIAVVAALIPILGIILAVIAIVLGNTARKETRPAPWQATAGFALGILAVAVSIGMFVLNAILMTS
jgi:hypothetical protein